MSFRDVNPYFWLRVNFLRGSRDRAFPGMAQTGLSQQTGARQARRNNRQVCAAA